MMSKPIRIWRAKGDESVWIGGDLYWAPKQLLDEFDRLNTQIERMQSDTSIMHAIFNSGMSKDERASLTYETGPYDITVLTCGIRKFVNTLIAKAGE